MKEGVVFRSAHHFPPQQTSYGVSLTRQALTFFDRPSLTIHTQSSFIWMDGLIAPPRTAHLGCVDERPYSIELRVDGEDAKAPLVGDEQKSEKFIRTAIG